MNIEEKEKSIRIGELLKKAAGKGREFTCFAQRLTGDARLFIDAATIAKANDGGESNLTYQGVCNVLKNELGIKVSPTPVRAHMRGDCSCQTKKNETIKHDKPNKPTDA